MELSGLKEIKKVEYVTTGFSCDVCDTVHNDVTLPDTWHEVTVQYDSWTYDIDDSRSIEHVCSLSCYHSLLKEQLKDLENEDRRPISIDGFSCEFAKQLLELMESKNIKEED